MPVSPTRSHSQNPLRSIATVIALLLAGFGSANASEWSEMSQEARDAYRHGQIWATYATNPALGAREIDVQVAGDTVTLRGTVETMVEKLLAESIALAAQDVTTIDNQLVIDPELAPIVATDTGDGDPTDSTIDTPTRGFAQRVEDATIAARVDSLLLWNDYTDGLDIDVTARAGEVTLTGVADTTGARQRASDIARHAGGVIHVVNRLRVDALAAAPAAGQVSDEWIEDRIARTWRYSTLVGSLLLDVDAENGEVTLSGQVSSPIEREFAIQLAQDTRGVDKVTARAIRVR